MRSQKTTLNFQMEWEVERFATSALADTMEPLSFFKAHGSKFPMVTKCAAVILNVPAGSVGPESVFSHSDRILGQHRTRLSGPRVDRCVCGLMRAVSAKLHAGLGRGAASVGARQLQRAHCAADDHGSRCAAGRGP